MYLLRILRIEIPNLPKTASVVYDGNGHPGIALVPANNSRVFMSQTYGPDLNKLIRRARRALTISLPNCSAGGCSIGKDGTPVRGHTVCNRNGLILDGKSHVTYAMGKPETTYISTFAEVYNMDARYHCPYPAIDISDHKVFDGSLCGAWSAIVNLDRAIAWDGHAYGIGGIAQ